MSEAAAAGDARVLDSLKRLTLELRETRQRLHAAAAERREPIAIVGMSCRFPGQVNSPEDLWGLLSAGRDSIGRFPADRGWDLAAVGSYTREGGFLDGPGEFDAELFGISPREAVAMDPQQRLLLETAWEAIERARIDPASVRGTQTGVFIGSNDRDYGALTWGSEAYADFSATGTAASVLSGRLSYLFGLEGPSITVDTACSSSLVALHLACQALRDQACPLALAGGVSLLSTPTIFQSFGRQGALAADGRCKAFAAAADGTGWGEGVGILLMERLRDAQANGHPVLAVVRGSAVNSDGASNGLTAPNGLAQQRVIRAALAAARLEPGEVDAVEAHGTGTTLGDPIEAHALLATYGQDRAEPLALGSVKSNIGHTQAAAGVAGVIKMVLALRHGELPATLHVDHPSPHVEWTAGAVSLLTERRPWPRTGRPRRAAVSAFGMSGTNAHLILEQAPAATGEDPSPDPPRAAALAGGYPWVLSARSAASLRAQAGRLRSFLSANPGAEPRDVGWSLASTRAALEHRAVIVAGERAETERALDALAAGAAAPGLVRGYADADGRAAFLFPGQGAQWAGMAADLLDSAPAFARRLMACERALAPHVSWRLSDVVRGAPGAPAWDRVEVLQPTLFAIMVSLAELWRCVGVEPSAVAGHSQGEIAAAVVAGALTLEDGARVVAVRSAALAGLHGDGSMLSAALTRRAAEAAIAAVGGQAAIAAVNGPRSVVFSGDRGVLGELAATLTARGVRTRELPVGYASHSAHVEAVHDRVLAELAGLQPRRSAVPFYSAVTGAPLDGADLDAGYWYRNLRQPVLFDQVTRRLLESEHTVLVEVSPHPVLAAGIEETLDDLGRPDGVVVAGTLRRQQPGPASFLTSLAELHVRGLAVAWEAVFPGDARAIDLPTYAFARKRYWAPAALGDRAGQRTGQRTGHPLLDAEVPPAGGGELVLTGRAALGTQPWLADHAVFSSVLFPGTAFLDVALSAARRAGAGELEELTMEVPLILPEQGGVDLQVRVGRPDGSGRQSVGVYARPAANQPAGEWVRHADGVISAARRAAPAAHWAGSWPPPGARAISAAGVYERLAAAGLSYGPAFRGLRKAWHRDDDLFVEVDLPAAEHDRFVVSPPLLDSALHGLALAAGAGLTAGLPFAWNGVTVFNPGAAPSRVRLSPAPGGGIALEAADAAGALVLSVRSLFLRPPRGAPGEAAPDALRSLFRIEWTPVRSASSGVASTAAAPARWALIGDDSPLPGTSAYPDLATLRQAVGAGGPLPDVVLFPVAGDGPDVAAATRAVLHRTLDALQEWTTQDRFGPSRLVILTSGAVAARDEDDVTDLPAAAAAGLTRSAQAEHPGRFVLVDRDPAEPLAGSWAALAAALGGDEPEVAVRSGRVLARRLVRAQPPSASGPQSPDLRDGAVLITGGTGTLGGLLARHLIARSGVRDLVLVGRRGPHAGRAGSLAAELAGLGADVRVLAGDVGDRGEVGRLLAAIRRERPLAAVIHAAGVLDDGVLTSLTPARIDRVLRPKAAGAAYLHEFLKDDPRADFILFSSAAATFGSPGQGNYAAANAFLDALAQHRHARGLPARSLAWGLWEQRSGMTGHLTASELAGRARSGAPPLTAETGLTLFDVALAMDKAALVPVRLEPARARAVPALLRGLVTTETSAETRGAMMAGQPMLTQADGTHRERELVTLICDEIAGVLGYEEAQEVSPSLTFLEMGFDSLSAVKLRNRLNEVTGLRLRSTIVFEETTPRALARYVQAELTGQVSQPDQGGLADANQARALGPDRRPPDSRPAGEGGPYAIATRSAAASAAPPMSDGSLNSFMWRAMKVGQTSELASIIKPLARLRPTFDSLFELGAVPKPVRLSTGSTAPALVCVTSILGKSDPSQYARLARACQGHRDVWALCQPGFRRGELLPTSLDALLEVHIATVRRYLTYAPVILIGQSASGLIANALASGLEAAGVAPAGVVLLDTYPPEKYDVLLRMGDAGADELAQRLERLDDPSDGLVDQWGDAWVTAMVRYYEFEYTAQPTAAPTLLLRAQEGRPNWPDDWRSEWYFEHDTIDVPGNHFTMMEDHVNSTAAAIETWLSHRSG